MLVYHANIDLLRHCLRRNVQSYFKSTFGFLYMKILIFDLKLNTENYISQKNLDNTVFSVLRYFQSYKKSFIILYLDIIISFVRIELFALPYRSFQVENSLFANHCCLWHAIATIKCADSDRITTPRINDSWKSSWGDDVLFSRFNTFVRKKKKRREKRRRHVGLVRSSILTP